MNNTEHVVECLHPGVLYGFMDVVVLVERESSMDRLVCVMDGGSTIMRVNSDIEQWEESFKSK
jgi:hypothetical protein